MISAIGALVGLVVAIALIIRRVPAAYSLMAGALAGGLVGDMGLVGSVAAMTDGVRDVTPAILRILSAGICIGEAKGKDFIPAEELALSTALRPDAFPVADLDWDDAIRYLKKEALLLPAGTEKGYVLVRHKKFPLGFAKHLGNRANNLYPQEWRIRTGYIPEQVKTFE